MEPAAEKVATRTAAAQWHVPWAEKGVDRNARAASPTVRPAAARLGPLAEGGERGHFLRNTKGFIGSLVGLRDEGSTGQFNPETTLDPTGVRYTILLPEVREKDWTTGAFIRIIFVYGTSDRLEARRAATAAWKDAPSRRLALGA